MTEQERQLERATRTRRTIRGQENQYYLTLQQRQAFKEARKRGYVTLRGASGRLHNVFWRWCSITNRVYCDVTYQPNGTATFHADAYSASPTYQQPEIGNDFCDLFYDRWQACKPRGRKARIEAGKVLFWATGIPKDEITAFAAELTQAINAHYQAALEYERAYNRREKEHEHEKPAAV